MGRKKKCWNMWNELVMGSCKTTQMKKTEATVNSRKNKGLNNRYI